MMTFKEALRKNLLGMQKYAEKTFFVKGEFVRIPHSQYAIVVDPVPKSVNEIDWQHRYENGLLDRPELADKQFVEVRTWFDEYGDLAEKHLAKVTLTNVKLFKVCMQLGDIDYVPLENVRRLKPKDPFYGKNFYALKAAFGLNHLDEATRRNLPSMKAYAEGNFFERGEFVHFLPVDINNVITDDAYFIVTDPVPKNGYELGFTTNADADTEFLEIRTWFSEKSGMAKKYHPKETLTNTDLFRMCTLAGQIDYVERRFIHKVKPKDPFYGKNFYTLKSQYKLDKLD
jgi:hypothetical protein